MSIQDWLPLGLTDLISLLSKGLSRVFSSTTILDSKASILWCSAFFMVQLLNLYMTTRKTIALTMQTFVGKVISLLFNMLSRFEVCHSFLSTELLLLLLLLSHFSHVRLCATPETAAHQAPPSLGFSRQEHWSGLPFPSPMHESEK